MRSLLPHSLTWFFHTLLLAGIVAAPPVFSAQFNLTVTNGSGSGSYEEGSEVHIAAYPAPYVTSASAGSEPSDPLAPEQIFDSWSGDAAALEDPYAVRTTVIMPSADISVSAVYKVSEHWMPGRVISHFPTGHQGVIFWFHGTGGTGYGGYSLPGTSSFIKDAVSRKLAVVAIDSLNRADGTWSRNTTAAANTDMQRVAAVRNQLIANGKMSPADPVYLLGISDGGAFASLWTEENQNALGFPVEATALYISTFEATVMDTSTVPTIFALAENDSVQGGIINPAAMQSFDMLIGRGVPTQLWVNTPSPVYPERFWAIEGLTLNDSESIYNSLKQGGFLDADDFLIENPNYSGWQLATADYSQYQPEMEWELMAAYAEHGFMSEFNDKVLDFLVNPATILQNSPVVTDVSPSNGYPYAAVTITGAQFFDISDVRFNGVSVEDFAVVAGTSIMVQVPVGATTGPVEVINGTGTAVSSTDFIVLPPTITGFTPESGSANTVVEIIGEGFVDVSSVTFNSVPAEILDAYYTSLWVKVPSGASTGPIEVTNYAGMATSPSEFVISGPEIAALEPASGGVNTAVKITGTNMGDLVAVRFAGVAVTEILYSSGTVIWVKVPTGATTGPVQLETSTGTNSSATDFVILNPPVIDGHSPNYGPTGTQVVLTGSGFSGTTQVKFGAVETTSFVVDSDTQITATVPVRATTAKILVINGAGYSLSPRYFFVTQ